jgi:hypothetical protein
VTYLLLIFLLKQCFAIFSGVKPACNAHVSIYIYVVSPISGTAGNHTEPCQESREPGEPTECRAWPGNPDQV